MEQPEVQLEEQLEAQMNVTIVYMISLITVQNVVTLPGINLV